MGVTQIKAYAGMFISNKEVSTFLSMKTSTAASIMHQKPRKTKQRA